jgi:hypothetical protein
MKKIEIDIKHSTDSKLFKFNNLSYTELSFLTGKKPEKLKKRIKSNTVHTSTRTILELYSMMTLIANNVGLKGF